MKKIQRVIEFVIRLIVSLFPRNSHLIVYGGSWDLFIDNVKYQFIINNDRMPDYNHLWLTNNLQIIDYMKSHGYKYAKARSIKGIYYILRAGFVVYDDGIDYFSYHNLSMGAVRINIWHGIAAKMLSATVKDEDHVMYTNNSWWQKYKLKHTKGDYNICTSKYQVRIHSHCFNIIPEHILIGGYPRTMTFFMSPQERLSFISKYELKSFVDYYNYLMHESKRKIIYMPTFRDADKNYLDKAIPDWDCLDEECAKANAIVYLKLHRVSPVPNLSHLSNIKILDNRMDVYPLLPLFDLLITDYSSIMFDFALLNKPILLYTFDIEKYEKESRHLYNHFLELIKHQTVINDFHSFLECFSLSDNEIRKFPLDIYFEKPLDFDVVPSLINSLS